MFGDLFSFICQICGANVGDAKAHQQWHDALAGVIRSALKPEASDEEWADYVRSVSGPVDPEALARFAGRIP